MLTRLPRPDAILVFALLFLANRASAGAPGWVDDAIAAAPACGVKAGPEDDALVLLAEVSTSVGSRGEIRVRSRTVTRLLRKDALQKYTHESVVSNDRIKVLELRGWRVDSNGKVAKTKQREAIEMAAATGAAAGSYSDLKESAIFVADPAIGDVIAFESEWESREDSPEGIWPIQREVPVCLARYVLELPSGWTHDATFVNGPSTEPARDGRTLTWERRGVSGVAVEASMPAWPVHAAWMRVRFIGRDGAALGRVREIESWEALGRWYYSHAAPALEPSFEVQAAAERTFASGGIPALAALAQKDVRYVAIELGTGSYIPRRAGQVLANRYGDCKDKATLLSSMLRTRGIDSRLVLIHHIRGMTPRDVPSMRAFDHVILAIALPADAEVAAHAPVLAHPKLGRLLFFDPTDELTPYGRLPPELEGTLGLLVGPEGGELLTLPGSPPEANVTRREVRAAVLDSGTISGSVREEWTGAPARRMRARMLAESEKDRQTLARQSIASSLSGASVNDLVVENLRDTSKPLVVGYRFSSERFAVFGSGIVTMRRSLFEDSAISDSLLSKERVHPIEFDWAGHVENDVELVLPAGVAASELPPPVSLESPFAKYDSTTELVGSTLRTRQKAVFRERQIRPADVTSTRTFFRKVRESERAHVVLERKKPQPQVP